MGDSANMRSSMLGEPHLQVYTTPPAALVTLLKQHIPHSLPLLRRLQFTQFPGGITEHARILFAAPTTLPISADSAAIPVTVLNDKILAAAAASPEKPFAAAYLDFSRGPETEAWVYSSLESRGSELVPANISSYPVQEADPPHGDDQVKGSGQWEEQELSAALTVMREIKRQRDLYTQNHTRLRPEVFLGTFNEKLRLALYTNGGCTFPYIEIYDKWLLRIERLPNLPPIGSGTSKGDQDNATAAAGLGLHWTEVGLDDIALVLSRSPIPRKERTVKLLPSKALALEDGTLVAWAFLGPDSSLSSLHCEPEYRGKGLAKAVAVKLITDHLADYGDDGYSYADVSPSNLSSQGVCKSLGGAIAWQMSWCLIDLDQSFP